MDKFLTRQPNVRKRACSDVQENKPSPTNESDKIIDCEALDSILDSTPLTTLPNKKPKKTTKDFFPWKEEYLQTFPFLEKRNSDDACGFRLFCKICLEFPDKVHKSSNLGKKGFSGNEEGFKAENFTRHKNEGGHKTAVVNYEKKYSALQVVGPMDKFSNQLTAELSEQLQAKFVACNLVCTEGLAITKFSPILRSYEILGVNVGSTHRNDQGFKIFCAIMANCLRLAQVDRYKNGDTFTVNLDTFTIRLQMLREGPKKQCL